MNVPPIVFQIRKNETHCFDYFELHDYTFEYKELSIRVSYIVSLDKIVAIDGDASDITSNYDISDKRVLKFFANTAHSMTLEELSLGIPFNILKDL